ncbi:hypothetical protein HCN51_45390 [Nonomuraea sp. FMUSA5-5]|uniref:Alcohol dehydrogenase-like C-terminal domain-containing protein n=1 Tax=Nonomuraea composti TaxID=2720023 RepID=A0ABX1BJA8_9ACTN|nr:hypothetical protein [Nonomuraea sp. FMUSA5-5]NJP96592.1 hypothetical protein [Nonomuraea sp. FMUSA5-5]
MIEEGRDSCREKVLVSGGIGSVAVLLLSGRIHVVATALSKYEAYVRDLWVGGIVNYRDADTIEECLRRSSGGVDAIIDPSLKGDELITPFRAVRPRRAPAHHHARHAGVLSL